jgi:hypothetical protein
MNTWKDRELVVLGAIVEAEELGGDPNEAAMSIGDFSYDERLRCIQRLHDGGYIEARFNRGDNRIMGAHVLHALPPALRAVGVWPTSATPLEEKRRRRLAFMERLYERTDGDPLARINFRDIGAELGWSEDEAQKVAFYLKDESLLKFPVMGGAVSLTHAGVVEMEAAMEHPDRATLHFPPVSVINVYGDVRDSQLQAGAYDSRQEREGP